VKANWPAYLPSYVTWLLTFPVFTSFFFNLVIQITRHLSPYEQQAIMPWIRTWPKKVSFCRNQTNVCACKVIVQLTYSPESVGHVFIMCTSMNSPMKSSWVRLSIGEVRVLSHSELPSLRTRQTPLKIVRTVIRVN